MTPACYLVGVLFRPQHVPPYSRCYGPQYAARCLGSLRRHCHAEHECILLTDYDPALFARWPWLTPVPLVAPTGSWRDLLQVLRIDDPVPCLFVGLDSFALSDITDIATCARPGELLMLRAAREPSRLSNAVMCWRECSRLWDALATAEAPRFRYWAAAADLPDEMAMLAQHATGELGTRFPGRLLHWSLHVRDRRDVPAGASIVYFAGETKPHNVVQRHPWMRDIIAEHWECIQ